MEDWTEVSRCKSAFFFVPSWGILFQFLFFFLGQDHRILTTTFICHNRHDFASGKDTVLGSHDDAVRAMAYSTANSKGASAKGKRKRRIRLLYTRLTEMF